MSNIFTIELPAKVLPPVELKRTAAMLETPSDALTEFATEAQNKLGYRALADRVNPHLVLGVILTKLRIPVFDKYEVARYKEFMKSSLSKTSIGNSYVTASWSSTSLRNYEEPVPISALEKALAIREVCPDAEFTVDHLTFNYKTYDPFLRVRFKEEEYTIDVWDEPLFQVPPKMLEIPKSDG